jgi:hypothetical protein
MVPVLTILAWDPRRADFIRQELFDHNSSGFGLWDFPATAERLCGQERGWSIAN